MKEPAARAAAPSAAGGMRAGKGVGGRAGNQASPEVEGGGGGGGQGGAGAASSAGGATARAGAGARAEGGDGARATRRGRRVRPAPEIRAQPSPGEGASVEGDRGAGEGDACAAASPFTFCFFGINGRRGSGHLRRGRGRKHRPPRGRHRLRQLGRRHQDDGPHRARRGGPPGPARLPGRALRRDARAEAARVVLCHLADDAGAGGGDAGQGQGQGAVSGERHDLGLFDGRERVGTGRGGAAGRHRAWNGNAFLKGAQPSRPSASTTPATRLPSLSLPGTITQSSSPQPAPTCPPPGRTPG